MDGLTWTNQQGQQSHIYHFLDQSTLFQTAAVTRSHTVVLNRPSEPYTKVGFSGQDRQDACVWMPEQS